MSIAKHSNSKNEYEVMISKAIDNAAKFGIRLYHPFLNSANGNCAFEAVIDNINSRPCFGETYSESPDYYRAIWMDEIEKIGFEDWNMGLSKTEWHNEFTLLRNSRAYENTVGDLIIPGIAHAIRKNILIFDTSSVAYTPAFVVSASVFGSSPSTDIPVCLAYDRSHYEQLIPASDNDIIKTVQLSKKLMSISRIDEGQSTNNKKERCRLSDYESNFPSLPSAKNLKAFEESFCLMTLTELKQIPVKQRTKEQQSRYKSLMYDQSRQKLCSDQLEEKRKKNRENMKNARNRLDEKRKEEIKGEDRIRKKMFHHSLDAAGKSEEKLKQNERKKNFRSKLEEEKKMRDKSEQQQRMRDFRKNLDNEGKNKEKFKQQQRMRDFRNNLDKERKVEENLEQQRRMKEFRSNLDDKEKSKEKLKQQQRKRDFRNNLDEERKVEEKLQQQKRMKEFRINLDEEKKK